MDRLDTLMAQPFPDGHITTGVINEQIALGGWKAATCPLCAALAASWSVEGRDAHRYLCPQCQRFIITGPKLAALRTQESENSSQAAQHKADLSRRAAA